MNRQVSVLGSYLQTRRRFHDRDTFDRWQARQVRRALRRARRRFPYYAGLTGTDLDDFPIMTKSIVTEHFRELNDRGLELADCLAVARHAEADRDFTAALGGVSIGLSSGTSGRQSVFLTSPAERARWAGAILAKALPHGLRGGARIALVLRAGGPLYEAVGTRRIAFRFFDLAQPLDEHLAGMVDFAPTILAAPPQALRYLAEARRGGRLPIAPERLFSIAEVLDPHDQALIEAAFDQRVDQIYQATEGFLGISCGHGRLHLNEDLVHIEREVIDPAGQRFVPIVTDLYRRTQAVVRLRLDDVLVASDTPCPCGCVFQVIDQVEGRCDDVLLLPGNTGDELRPVFADFVRGAILAASGVQDFRFVQQTPDRLLLAVRPASAYAEAAAALADLFIRSGVRVPHIEADPTASWQDTPSAVKLRRVRRGFPAAGHPGRPPSD